MQATNKKLLCNIAYLLRKSLVVCSNNTKFCYNRIVHLVASLAMQRIKMPKDPILSIFATIQNIIHIVRIAFRDSTSSINRKSLAKSYQEIL